MFLARRHRDAFARGVATVLLLAALAPAVARGLAHAQDRASPWRVLCSAAGDDAAAAAAAPGSSDRTTAQLLHHCPLCQHGTDAPPLPAGQRHSLQRAWLPTAQTRPTDGPPRQARLLAWASVRARAPPARG